MVLSGANQRLTDTVEKDLANAALIWRQTSRTEVTRFGRPFAQIYANRRGLGE
jgi:hypothetical protein